MTADRQGDAIHEAGHAVAHVRLDIEQGNVSIVPDEATLGRSFARGAAHCSTRDEASNMVLACLAGYAAEIAFGSSEPEAVAGCASDFAEADSLIDLWGLEDIRLQKQYAVALMSEARNRIAVSRLAEELVRTGSVDADIIPMLVEIADGDSTEADLARQIALKNSLP